MVDNKIIEKVMEDAIGKSRLVVLKCGENSTTRRGEGATVTLTGNEGEEVPTRHLQDKGYDENGNHLGYIARIDYPDGTSINYVEGTLNIDGVNYQMGFDDNYKKSSNGKLQHVLKGSANGLFKPQRKDIIENQGKSSWKHVVEYGTLMKRSNITNELKNIIRKEGHLPNSIQERYAGTPLGKLAQGHNQMDNIAKNTNCDYKNIVVGEQIKNMNSLERRTITTTPNDMTSTSVGFLNDKSLMKHNRVTGESRSVDGNTYNWDNTYKIYTVIPQGSGAKGVYLGYAQNEKIGAWDNSGNSHNELVLPSGQTTKKLLVDEQNKIIIQSIMS